MSEFEQDPRIAALLVAAAEEAGGHIQPRGVDAVVRTVDRRRTRTVGVAALAVALVAILAPVTVLSLTGRHTPAPPVGNRPSTVASAGAAPSDSASPVPSGSPSGAAAPDRRIAAGQLRNATLQIPAWPKGFDDGCPTGAVKFTDGKSQDGQEALRGDPVYVDVDHDAAPETVVLVACTPQGSDYQVIALDRDPTGRIVTFGRIVGSAGNTGTQGSDIMTIWAVQAGGNGQVRVDVGEFRPCCDAAQASQHQWRAYGWNGTRFTQTGGPTSFGPNPKVTDLVISADRLTMVKQGDGSWVGTLKVTVRNAAAFATPGKVLFQLGVDGSWQARPGAECRFTPGESPLACTLPGLGSGASRVLTIQVTAPAGPLSTRCDLNAGAVDASGAGYPDRKVNGVATTAQVVEG